MFDCLAQSIQSHVFWLLNKCQVIHHCWGTKVTNLPTIFALSLFSAGCSLQIRNTFNPLREIQMKSNKNTDSRATCQLHIWLKVCHKLVGLSKWALTRVDVRSDTWIANRPLPVGLRDDELLPCSRGHMSNADLPLSFARIYQTQERNPIWKVVKMEIDQARGESCHRSHHTFDPTFDPPSMLPPVRVRVPTSAIITFNENPTNLPSLHFIALKWQYGEIFLKIVEHWWTWNNWISLEIGSVLDQTLPPSSPLLLSVACHQLQVRLYKLALSNFRENHFIQGRDLFPLSATP